MASDDALTVYGAPGMVDSPSALADRSPLRGALAGFFCICMVHPAWFEHATP